MKKMKKVMSAILAATMVMSMSLTAFAAVTQDAAPVVPKTYKVNNGTAPAETFTFKFEGQTYVNGDGQTVENPTIPAIADVSIAFDATSQTVSDTVTASVNADDYNLGVYTYKVTEVTPETLTAGIDYSDEELYLVLTVIRDETNGKHYFAAMHYESTDDKVKTQGFTNEYDSGSLSVTKHITGNMADMDKTFNFTIVFTAPTDKAVNSDITVTKPDKTTETINFETGENTCTYNIALGDEDTVSFANLPAGVTYTVTEDYENYEKKNETYSDNTKTISANDTDTYEVTNELTNEVDTGISLDSIPYIMLLAFAAFGLFGFVAKKREEQF